MKKSTLIRIGIVIAVIILLIAGIHLVGSNIMPMIKNHMGL